MAILLPNKDGTSSANVGDIVVTGGGIYEKTANGSVRRTDLEAQSGYSGGVGDYHTLSNTVYNTVRAALSNGSSSGGSGGNNQSIGGDTMPTPAPAVDLDTSTDVNGIVSFDDFENFGAYGYDPNYFATNTSGTGAGVKTALGYVAVGLVGLVILDRLVSGGGR